MDGRVAEAMRPFLSDSFYNPSATYAPAVAVAKELQAARMKVAHWLGARPSELVFTAGGTESDNLAVHGLMRQSPEANVVVSSIEHEAVLRPAALYDCRIAAAGRQGIVDLESIRSKIDDRTLLVSVMYANNELGTIQPLREVSRLVQEVRDGRRKSGNDLPIYLHTDACQAAPYLDLHAARLGVDLMTINGGKIYGPKQSGVLYVRGGIVLRPLVQGGGQERGLRSGTENVAACVGLATALDLVQQGRHDESERLRYLQELFAGLLQEQLPEARVNGTMKRRLPNNLHVTIPGQDNERLIYALEARGVLAAAGSACSASSGEPSHVLTAIGLSDDEARASLRFSMGRMTDEAQIRQAVAALKDSLAA